MNNESALRTAAKCRSAVNKEKISRHKKVYFDAFSAASNTNKKLLKRVSDATTDDLGGPPRLVHLPPEPQLRLHGLCVGQQREVADALRQLPPARNDDAKHPQQPQVRPQVRVGRQRLHLLEVWSAARGPRPTTTTTAATPPQQLERVRFLRRGDSLEPAPVDGGFGGGT